MKTYAIYLSSPDQHPEVPNPLCEQAELHTPCPSRYVPWHEWAERMARTHAQQRCPACGKWFVWTPEKGAGIGN